MSEIRGAARLGSTPTLRYINVGDDKKPVCEFTAIFLNYKKNKQATGPDDEYIDRGFWVRVSVWGKFAEQVSSLFACGDKVYIADGNMDQDSFTPKDAKDGDEDVKLLHVDCHLIFPWLSDLDSLNFKERKKDK